MDQTADLEIKQGENVKKTLTKTPLQFIFLFYFKKLKTKPKVERLWCITV